MATDTTNLTMNRITGQAVPGITDLNPKAQDLINNMLSGVPGTSQTRRDAAYLGAGAGVPGSDVANRWGYDLYNKRGEAMQQQGLGDLLQFLQSGQQQQQLDLSKTSTNLEAQRLAQQNTQFGQELALKKHQVDVGDPNWQKKQQDAINAARWDQWSQSPGVSGNLLYPGTKNPWLPY